MSTKTITLIGTQPKFKISKAELKALCVRETQKQIGEFVEETKYALVILKDKRQALRKKLNKMCVQHTRKSHPEREDDNWDSYYDVKTRQVAYKMEGLLPATKGITSQVQRVVDANVAIGCMEENIAILQKKKDKPAPIRLAFQAMLADIASTMHEGETDEISLTLRLDTDGVTIRADQDPDFTL